MEHHGRGQRASSVPIMPRILSVLRLFGLAKEKSCRMSARNVAVHTTFVLLLLTCMIPETILICSSKYDMFEKSETMAIILPFIRCMFKALNRILTMDTFWDLYGDIQRVNDFYSRDPASKKILEERANSAQRLFKYFMSFYFFLFVLFNIVPLVAAAARALLGHPSGLHLQFKAEYFMDTSENPAFAIIYTVQALAAIATLYPAIWDSVFLSACIHVHALVHIVTNEFEKLGDEYQKEHPEQISGDEEEDSDIKRCIDHHKVVIALVNKLADVFSAQMAMECFVSAALTCLSLFQVTYSNEMSAKIKYFCLGSFFYAGFYVQIYHGQRLLDESKRLERAVYGVPWAGCGARRGRLVLQALQRAQRPLVITAMHFYVISSETYLKMLKATFSYFALLQTVAEE